MESFEQIYEQYTPMIYSIIRKLNIYKNKDEFFQVGLVALWESHQRFNPEKGTFTNYAYSFIVGRILSELGRKKQEQESITLPSEEFWESLMDQSTSNLLEEETLLTYCQCGQLTEKETKWVLYCFLKGFTIHEIAVIENVSCSAVKHWRTNAKEKLRKTHLNI